MLRRNQSSNRLLSDDLHVIELSIPLHDRHILSSVTGNDVTCHICTSTFCKAPLRNKMCCRTSTHLKCCTQALCCSCLTKLAKRCTCKHSCTEIIAFCPFCREISPLSKEELYRGSRDLCTSCKNPPPDAEVTSNCTSTEAQLHQQQDEETSTTWWL
jgi:hypothetical protein